jgi:hypothetical protein
VGVVHGVVTTVLEIKTVEVLLAGLLNEGVATRHETVGGISRHEPDRR